MVVELSSETGSLRLRTDDDGWCHVELVVAGISTPLGADDQRIVNERLSNALVSTLGGPWVDGVGGKVVFVMSLAEHHGTIYAADVQGVRTIFLQDGQGQDLGQLSLLPAERRRWSEQLLA